MLMSLCQPTIAGVKVLVSTDLRSISPPKPVGFRTSKRWRAAPNEFLRCRVRLVGVTIGAYPTNDRFRIDGSWYRLYRLMHVERKRPPQYPDFAMDG